MAKRRSAWMLLVSVILENVRLVLDAYIARIASTTDCCVIVEGSEVILWLTAAILAAIVGGMYRAY
jgi:hypothetical protein